MRSSRFRLPRGVTCVAAAMAEFTIAVPVYNGEDHLADALRSIATQDLDGLEVLVSNNGSTDRTSEILDEWKGRLPLREIRRSETLPMQSHFNALLDEIHSEAYMLLCHDDLLASPDAISEAREVMRKHPEIAVVYCDLLYVDSHGGRLADRKFGRSGPFDALAVGKKTLDTGRNLFGIPLAVRRLHLGELRYDPRFHYTMDVDLSWELGRRGGAWHIDRPMIANRYTQSNTTWRLLAHAHREYVGLAEKHLGKSGPLTCAKLWLVCKWVGAQKALFGAYATLRAAKR